MNRLKINVVTLKEDEYLIRDSIRFENCSYLQLFIDDKDIATYPDFEDILIVPTELYKSSLQSGEYLLFTCACGVADDGGWATIKVTHSEAIVQWDFLRDKPYCFKFSNLISHFHQGKSQKVLTTPHSYILRFFILFAKAYPPNGIHRTRFY